MKQLQPHQFKYVALFVVIAAVILFAVGGFFSEQCTSIGEFKACWKTYTVLVKSSFCPDGTGPCLAKPQLQQNNAMVDMILSACTKAQSLSYTDKALNDRISEVVKEFTGYTATADTICDEPGRILINKFYD